MSVGREDGERAKFGRRRGEKTSPGWISVLACPACACDNLSLMGTCSLIISFNTSFTRSEYLILVRLELRSLWRFQTR